jgi:hypothetical protein
MSGSKEESDDTMDTKSGQVTETKKGAKRRRIINNGKGPLKYYKWLLASQDAFEATEGTTWIMKNSGPWGSTWSGNLVMRPQSNYPDEGFGYFPNYQDDIEHYLRVKLSPQDLSYVEKKGAKVKRAIQIGSGIDIDPLISIIIDYSSPSIFWITFKRRPSVFNVHAFGYDAERHVSLSDARGRKTVLLSNGVVDWVRVFEMVLNPRTLVCDGPMPRAARKKKKNKRQKF